MTWGSGEKSFDQEIHEEIIPSLLNDSEYMLPQPKPIIMGPVQQKWFSYSPASNISASKKRGKKWAHDPVPSNSPASTLLPNDSDSNSVKNAPNKHQHTIGPNDQSDDNNSVKISAYIYVSAPAPPVVKVGSCAVRALAPKVTPRGPFVFKSTTFTVVGHHKDFVISVYLPPHIPNIQDVVSSCVDEPLIWNWVCSLALASWQRWGWWCGWATNWVWSHVQRPGSNASNYEHSWADGKQGIYINSDMF